jgi:hypothetical protein
MDGFQHLQKLLRQVANVHHAMIRVQGNMSSGMRQEDRILQGMLQLSLLVDARVLFC